MFPCWHISSRSSASHPLGFCRAELFCFNFNLSDTQSSSCLSSLDEKCLRSNPSTVLLQRHPAAPLQLTAALLFLCGNEFGQIRWFAKLTGERGKVSRWKLEAHSITGEHMFWGRLEGPKGWSHAECLEAVVWGDKLIAVFVVIIHWCSWRWG